MTTCELIERCWQVLAASGSLSVAAGATPSSSTTTLEPLSCAARTLRQDAGAIPMVLGDRFISASLRPALIKLVLSSLVLSLVHESESL